MAGTVTTKDLTTITNAEAADSGSWDDVGGGGGSGQDTAESVLQGSACRSRKAAAVVDHGFGFDHTTDIDFRPRGRHLGMWFNAYSPGLIDKWQVHMGEASTHSTSPWYGYSLYATGTYPDTGGWIRKYIDPTLLDADNSAGTITYQFRFFGITYSTSASAGSSDNMRIDSMHYTTGTRGGGLLVDGGTVPSPATFGDFVSADEGTSANRYGVVESRDGVIFCHAQLWIADATATIFNDTGTTLVFADHNTGGADTVRDDFMGLIVDLQNASTDVDIANAVIKSGGTPEGALYCLTDSTPGALDIVDSTLANLRVLYINHDTTINDCTIDSCGQIDPENGDHDGEITISTTSHYLDTTTSVDMSSTSDDFEIIACASKVDWTPTTTGYLASHGRATAAQTQFQFGLNTTGQMELVVGDGSATSTHTSTALPTRIQDGSTREYIWMRAVYDYDGGAATDASVDFYYSEDGPDTPWQDVTWTLHGTSDQTQRSMSSASFPLCIGRFSYNTATNSWVGNVKFVTMCINGFFNTGTANDGDNLFRFDMRTGGNFVSNLRADDWNSALTWEVFGSPTIATGSGWGEVADLQSNSIANSTSTAALWWNVNTDPNGDIDNCVFTSSGTGHAIELGPNCPSSITLTSITFSGYAGTDGDTGNEAIYNNSGKAITVNISGGGTPTVRNGTDASTTVLNTVTVSVNGVTEGAQCLVIAESGGYETAGTEIMNKAADSTGAATITDHNYGGPPTQPVTIKARMRGTPAAAIHFNGAAAYDDETTSARERVTNNDLALCPRAGDTATTAAYYFGCLEQFTRMRMYIATPGSGTYANVWEYYNGSGWLSLTTLTDTIGPKFDPASAGYYELTLEPPGNWATTTINSQGPYYYIRSRLTSVTLLSVSPLGGVVTFDTPNYLPFVTTGTITDSGLTTTAVWIEDPV